jgi:hypothetical protein
VLHLGYAWLVKKELLIFNVNPGGVLVGDAIPIDFIKAFISELLN